MVLSGLAGAPRPAFLFFFCFFILALTRWIRWTWRWWRVLIGRIWFLLFLFRFFRYLLLFRWLLCWSCCSCWGRWLYYIWIISAIGWSLPPGCIRFIKAVLLYIFATKSTVFTTSWGGRLRWRTCWWIRWWNASELFPSFSCKFSLFLKFLWVC